MDIPSRQLNTESILGIFDPAFRNVLEDTFRKDLEQAKEIRLEEWKRREPHRAVRAWTLSASYRRSAASAS